MSDAAWYNPTLLTGYFFGLVTNHVDISGSFYLESEGVISLPYKGIYGITYVVSSVSPERLNSVLLSSAQTLSNCSISSEVANLGPAGGGYFDIWGQVITATSAGASIIFVSGTTALAAAFGSNWNTGQWNCSQLNFLRLY